MAGGIEKQSILLMNQLVDKGYRVGVVTWDSCKAEPHYFLDSRVTWYKLDLGSPFTRASSFLRFKRQIRIRKFVKDFSPDVSIAYQVGTFLAAKISMLGLNVPLIAAERNSPDLFDYVQNGKKLRQRAEFILRFASAVTVQFEEYFSKYPIFLHSKLVSINNPVSMPDLSVFPNNHHPSPKRILSLGRLSFQKNQSFLISSFALIANDYPDWVLTLVGEGEKRAELEELVDQLSLHKQVEFIGASKQVELWFEQSSFLAFPSLWEGFPNALAESLAYGLPAIGFNSTAGVNVLIDHNYNGLLVDNNEQAFADGMVILINDCELRIRLGANAIRSVDCYEPQKVFKQWEELFCRLAANKSL